MAKETTWQYKPDGQAGDDQDEMIDDAPAQKLSAKDESYSWTASEYIDHKQGTSWFIALAIATLMLAAVIYLLTREIFATSVTIIVGALVGVFAKRTPRQLTYELNGKSLIIGEKTYPYNLFKSFFIIQDGALLSLNLEPIKRFMPPVSAYFDPADHEKIFGLLEGHLPYEERGLEPVERLTRRLRF